MDNKVYLFEKEGFYGVLVIDYLPDRDLLGSYSTKTQHYSNKEVENPLESKERINRALKITLNNGWKVIYLGERNYDM